MRRYCSKALAHCARTEEIMNSGKPTLRTHRMAAYTLNEATIARIAELAQMLELSKSEVVRAAVWEMLARQIRRAKRVKAL